MVGYVVNSEHRWRAVSEILKKGPRVFQYIFSFLTLETFFLWHAVSEIKKKGPLAISPHISPFWLKQTFGFFASSIWDFEKGPLAISLHFSPFWLEQTLKKKKMYLIRSAKANLCPNMIHFDGLDFSECHAEEVTSFFWCSLYFAMRALICKKYIIHLINSWNFNIIWDNIQKDNTNRLLTYAYQYNSKVLMCVLCNITNFIMKKHCIQLWEKLCKVEKH